MSATREDKVLYSVTLLMRLSVYLRMSQLAYKITGDELSLHLTGDELSLITPYWGRVGASPSQTLCRSDHSPVDRHVLMAVWEGLDVHVYVTVVPTVVAVGVVCVVPEMAGTVPQSTGESRAIRLKARNTSIVAWRQHAETPVGSITVKMCDNYS